MKKENENNFMILMKTHASGDRENHIINCTSFKCSFVIDVSGHLKSLVSLDWCYVESGCVELLF